MSAHEPADEAPATVGILLVDDRGWILLQLRDGQGIYPHHWATVGGAVEPGETIDAALRRSTPLSERCPLATALTFTF